MEKVKIALFALSIALISCGPSKAELEKRFNYSAGFHTIVIDSCEYIYKDEYKVGTVLVHKANCKNTFHKK